MDTLFNELLEQIASLHTVGQAALNGPLSAKGQRDKCSGFLPMAVQGWNRYVSEIKEKYGLLRKTLQAHR